MNKYYDLSFRYILRKKKSSVITTFSVVVGMSILCSILICIDTLLRGGLYDKLEDGGYSTPILIIIICVVLLVTYVSMLIVRGTFSINVTERIKEMAVLKSIGAENTQLYRLFLVENAILGSIGMLIGIIISYSAVSAVFCDMVKSGSLAPTYKVRISCAIVLIVLVVGAFTLLLAMIEPFRQLRKSSLQQAINKNYAVNCYRKKIKKTNGVLFKLFGVEGEYAYKYARRSTKSFMIVVTSFVIAITLYIAVEGLAGSCFKRMLRGDIDYYDAKVSFLSDNESNKKLLTDSGMFEEIIKDTSLYLPNYDSKLSDDSGKNGFIVLEICNEKELTKLAKAVTEGKSKYKEIMSNGALMFIPYDKKDCKLKAGDKYSLLSSIKFYNKLKNNESLAKLIKEYMDKIAPDSLEDIDIVSVIRSEDKEDSGTIRLIMTQEYFDSCIGKDLINGSNKEFKVKTKENVNEDEVNAYFNNNSIMASMEFNSSEYSEYRSIKDIRSKVYYGIFVIALAGIFFIINSLSSEQIRRNSEYSILRSIGMDKIHLIKMVILEKGLMCMIAYVIGVIIGNFVAYSWISSINELMKEEVVYTVPIKAMVIALFALLMISGVAAVIPINFMKKNEMKISYE